MNENHDGTTMPPPPPPPTDGDPDPWNDEFMSRVLTMAAAGQDEMRRQGYL